jgi:hypothetical protein
MPPEHAHAVQDKLLLFERALPDLLSVLLDAGDGFDDAPVPGTVNMDILVARAFGDVWDLSEDVIQYMPAFNPNPIQAPDEVQLFTLHARCALPLGAYMPNSDGAMQLDLFQEHLLKQVSALIKDKQKLHPQGIPSVAGLKPVGRLTDLAQWNHKKIETVLREILARVEAAVLLENTASTGEGSGRGRL